ncbi:hypothetical protein VP01_1527g3 [Puccinia sorghi]|uniref:Pentacotripeptide-repeat region of PRORP domain-containing protein n=1 Tax=Puccinia sorghi TaxID=27349 RepID=A0A0L6VJ88_9BASI|nr:hypothetical protein VP01_1527g3 [Puccinia sorghi]
MKPSGSFSTEPFSEERKRDEDAIGESSGGGNYVISRAVPSPAADDFAVGQDGRAEDDEGSAEGPMFQVITLSTCLSSARLSRPSTTPPKLLAVDAHPRKASSYSFKKSAYHRAAGRGQASLMPSQPKVKNPSSSSALSPSTEPSPSSLASKNNNQTPTIWYSGSIGERIVTNEAGPSTEIDTDWLLKELKSLQANVGRASKSSIHKRVKFHWQQWNEFLKTPKGRSLDPISIHNITHEFLFLYPSKILTIFQDTQHAPQRAPSSRVDSRTFKSIGFATLKYQNWNVLKQLLTRQRNLGRPDMLSIVRIASRKILFSSKLKTQTIRIEAILGLSEAITGTFDEASDCAKCMTQSVEILCDALLRMRGHEPAATMILRILRQHPNLKKYFASRFLHRLMSTCASHQNILAAHDLLAELPPELQTLDQFKAFWDALLSHPHLVPDLDAHNLYLTLKSRLGHVDDLIRMVSNMERRGILADHAKQKTYGILLHSIGRRRGLDSAYELLPELVSKGYVPDEYTSNILLSARKPIPNSKAETSRPRDERAEREARLLETMEKIKGANMRSDEVTRNILVRSFLSRLPYHSKEDISNIKQISLNGPSSSCSDSNLESKLDRSQFRRFRKPLYSMLCSAFRRANSLDQVEELIFEWKRESAKARSKSFHQALPKPLD